MSFFESFSALGYSGINLVLVFLVVLAVLYRGLGLHRRHWLFGAVLLVVTGAGFVFTTNFLASENLRLNDAIRDDGGLKRTFPED